VLLERLVSKMKIAWFCIPAHGHTNPTLGLVKEMIDAGHEVTYFSFEKFRKRLRVRERHLFPAMHMIWISTQRKAATE
jgi:hypothetical protein